MQAAFDIGYYSIRLPKSDICFEASSRVPDVLSSAKTTDSQTRLSHEEHGRASALIDSCVLTNAPRGASKISMLLAGLIGTWKHVIQHRFGGLFERRLGLLQPLHDLLQQNHSR